MRVKEEMATAIGDAVADGRVVVRGAVYDIESGDIRVIEPIDQGVLA